MLVQHVFHFLFSLLNKPLSSLLPKLLPKLLSKLFRLLFRSGESYMRIHEQGGGIYFTVRETNKSSYDDLLSKLKRTLNEMLRCGTTTVEIKTGKAFSSSNFEVQSLS